MSLESLYQEIILEHSKQRSGEHLVEVPAGHASADNHQYNPTCGDEINLRVVLSDELKDGEKTIESISWKATVALSPWLPLLCSLKWLLA